MGKSHAHPEKDEAVRSRIVLQWNGIENLHPANSTAVEFCCFVETRNLEMTAGTLRLDDLVSLFLR